MSLSSYARETLIHPAKLALDKSGVLVSVTRAEANWGTINFSARRLTAGQSWRSDTQNEEAALILLGAKAAVDCREEIRGGGNCTRQIVDVIRPEFPAEKLLICEVYTPSGNWSGCPPHKHDVHNSPVEVDLDETYYYRINKPEGYAFQRLYDAAGTRDDTLTLSDGDLVLIRDGYHPVVAAPGYNVYYLNVLAGSARSMAASDDPRYSHLRNNTLRRDPRVPLVRAWQPGSRS